MQSKKYYGLLTTLTVASMPILIWIAFSPIRIDLGDASQKIDALAKIAALSGLSLLSFNIILSARLPMFERLFLGLDRTYRAHRLIGGAVLILLLIHGALITAKYSNISFLSGYEYLKPNTDLPLMLGKITLGIMIVLVSISVYIKVKYQWFINIQRLLGALIFLGGYHALFVGGSDIRSNLLLFVYFSLIGSTAMGLYVYRSLFHRTIIKTLEYSVSSVQQSNGITVVWLHPTQKALTFYAGQFAFFRFDSQAVDTESHPFSISSNSDSSNIRIAVKASGDYTKELHRLSPGDLVIVEGPYGQFSFTKIQSTKQVWVAGGIGITPFLSMAHSVPSGYDITLYYCVRTNRQAIFLEELEKISLEKKGLKIILVCDDKYQRITGQEMVSNLADDYLICAPPSMMHALEKQLKELGVSSGSIHYEDFALT